MAVAGRDHVHELQPRCSIGIGPIVLLAKVAADMQKPNGLTVLADAELPHKLHRFYVRFVTPCPLEVQYYERI